MSEPARFSDDTSATTPSSAFSPTELCRAADDLAQQLRQPHNQEDLAHVAARAARALERIAHLHRASLVLASALAFDEVVEIVLSQGLSVLGALNAHIALLSDDATQLRTRTQRLGMASPAPWSERLVSESNPLDLAARTGQTLCFSAHATLLERHPDLPRELRNGDTESFAVLPLQIGQRTFGALGFGWRERHEFRRAEREFQAAFALQCAWALDRTRLLDAEHEARARAVAEARKNNDLLQSMSDGFVAFDRHLRFLFVNRAATELAGRPAELVLGKRLEEVFPAGLQSPFIPAAYRVLETGEPFTLEFESQLVERWLEVRGFPTPEGISVVFRDVTARRMAEERQRVLAEMSRIFDAGLNRDVMLQRIAKLVVPAIADSCSIELRLDGRLQRVAFAESEPRQPLEAKREVPLRTRGEEIGTIRIGCGSGRKRPEGLGFLTEVAERVATAIDLARLYEAEHVARRDAEEANRAKAEFLAVMSHELRTPLNAIGGYAELMELGVYGPLAPEYREFVGRIHASEEHLLNLINRILSFAKLEASAIEYEIADVPVSVICDSSEPLIRQQLNEKDLHYLVKVDAQLVVHADGDRVRQILLNLMSNAIKFTEPGGTITVLAQGVGERCRIEVRDTGVGIPKEKLNAIFDPFVQADRSLTRDAGGVGLGLAISRDLARGMNGDLTAYSEVGVGSTFVLELPRASVRGKAAAA